MTDNAKLFSDLGLSELPASLFIRSAEGLNEQPVRSHTHTLRRAWSSIPDLIGALCIGQRPHILFQSVGQSSAKITQKDHQRFWNLGAASMLARVSDTEVRIYSALAIPAMGTADVDAEHRLIRTFDRATETILLRGFLQSVVGGRAYEDYRSHFDPTQTVDRHLVENLGAARILMSAGEEAPPLAEIHKLLGRVLFICYLLTTARPSNCTNAESV